MGQAKKDMMKNDEENLHSGQFCCLGGEEIPKDDLKNADQGNGCYLCDYHRHKRDEMEKE